MILRGLCFFTLETEEKNMKKALVIVLALIMVLSALPVTAVYAEEASEITYSEHLTNNSDVGYTYDISDASIAWVKQSTGALIWVAADDTRSEDEIIAQGKKADPSLDHSVNHFAVLRGTGTAETPNTNGSKAVITVSANDGKTELSIDGKYSHFVSGKSSEASEPDVPAQPVEEDGEKVEIRIDVPLKMAVAFEDGTVYFGGEMKEVVVGKEYAFQMCSVNWDNGLFDDNENGIRGTVVYRMKVVHKNEFNELAREAKEYPERYTVKGIDIIDNEAKTVIVNCDAKDTHLETDVNNFFIAYKFHFSSSDYHKMTGIDKVINNPLESLSVNLPAGSTITCNAYVNGEKVDSANVFITRNSGEGEYDNVYLTSVNDFTWNI